MATTLVPQAMAAEFHVVNAAEFQDALDACSNNGEDDTIYLAAGTYGGNFKYSPTDGKSLTISGEPGATAQDIILDGGRTGRVLDMQGNMTGSLILKGLTIQNGRSNTHGGGIYLRPWGDSSVKMEIWNSIIRFNQAEKRGGGIKAHSHSGNSTIDLLIVNSLIYENQANWSGGGIDVSASEVGDNNVTRAVVINSTITDNMADYEGGGIRACAYDGNGALVLLDLYNTIVYGNRLSGGDPQDVYVKEQEPGNATVSAYHCDIGDVEKDPNSEYNPDNVINADPAFVDPGNDDYHLSAGSPCIDKGTTAAPDPPGLPSTDFEGNPRVYGSAPDIGAYEWQGEGIEEANSSQPTAYSLWVYSNPFNHKTVISYRSSAIGNGSLKIYGSDGRLVRTLPITNNELSITKVVWDGTANDGESLPNGIYFCRLETKGYQITKKLILLR